MIYVDRPESQATQTADRMQQVQDQVLAEMAADSQASGADLDRWLTQDET